MENLKKDKKDKKNRKDIKYEINKKSKKIIKNIKIRCIKFKAYPLKRKIPYIFSFAAILIYLSGVLFLNNNFAAGTTINNVDVAGYSNKQALQRIKNDMYHHVMKLEFDQSKTNNENSKNERKYEDKTVSYITMGATFNDNKALSEIKKIKAVNKWLWPLMINKGNNYTIDVYDFDDNIIQKTVKYIPYFNQKKQSEPQNAYIDYSQETGRYVIVPEKYGNDIDMDIVYNTLKEKFNSNIDTWTVNPSSLYEQPEITSANKELNQKLNFANETLNAHIYYFNNFEHFEQSNSSSINSQSYESFESYETKLTPKEMLEWLDDITVKDIESVEDKDKQNNEILLRKIDEFINKKLTNKYSIVTAHYSFQSKYGLKMVDGKKEKLIIDKVAERDEIMNLLKTSSNISRLPAFKNYKYTADELSKTDGNIEKDMKIIYGSYIEIVKNGEKDKSDELIIYFDNKPIFETNFKISKKSENNKEINTESGVYFLDDDTLEKLKSIARTSGQNKTVSMIEEDFGIEMNEGIEGVIDEAVEFILNNKDIPIIIN